MTRILVVDDDPDQATFVRRVARRLGVRCERVAHASCVDGAVACLAIERFDMVLLDHRVPPDDTAALAVPRLRRAGHAGAITVMSSAMPEPPAQALLAQWSVDFVSKFDLLDHLIVTLGERTAA